MIKFIISLILGLIVGLIIGSNIYLRSKKRIIINSLDDELLTKDEKKILKEKINKIYKYHNLTKKKEIKLFFGLIKLKKKFNYPKINQELLNLKETNELSFSKELLYLMNDVISIYHPDVDNPILEIPISEINQIIDDIINTLDKIIKNIGIPYMENISLYQIQNTVLIGRNVTRIVNNKAFRLSRSIINLLLFFSSIINPIYYLRKISNKVSTTSLKQLLIKAIFEILAYKVYFTYKELDSIYCKKNISMIK